MAPMKYAVGDTVRFAWEHTTLQGQVAVADFGGALGFDTHTYDVQVPGRGWYKHLLEADLTLVSAGNHKRSLKPLLADLLADAAADADKPRTDGSTQLDNRLATGRYAFTTRSGSRYQVTVTPEARALIRINAAHALPGDDAAMTLRYLDAMPGLPAVMIVGSENRPILRYTSPVVAVSRVS